jgi:hypothetical protein
MRRRCTVLAGALIVSCIAAASMLVLNRDRDAEQPTALLYYLSLYDNIKEGKYQVLRYAGPGYVTAVASDVKEYYDAQGWAVAENILMRENESAPFLVELSARRGNEAAMASVSQSGALVYVTVICGADLPSYPAGLTVGSLSVSYLDETGSVERVWTERMGAPPYDMRRTVTRGGAVLSDMIYNRGDNLAYFYRQGAWQYGAYDNNRDWIEAFQTLASLDGMLISWAGYSRPPYMRACWVLVHSVNEDLPDSLFRPPSDAGA